MTVANNNEVHYRGANSRGGKNIKIFKIIGGEL